MGEAMNGDKLFLCYDISGERRREDPDAHEESAEFHVHSKAMADGAAAALKALGFKVRVVRVAKTVLADELDEAIPGAGDEGASPS